MAVSTLTPLIYGIVALNTGDLLWAFPIFSHTPNNITVHCYGEDVSLEPGTTAFVDITRLVNGALSGRNNWDSLSLSIETYKDYQQHPKMMALELLYSEPVRVHSPYKFFSKIDTIIIPLDGRHAQTNAVFGRRLGYPTAGSFHVKTTAPLVEFLADQDLCTKP